MRNIEASESSKIWVPLDILLTMNISIYQLYYNYEQKYQEENIKQKVEASIYDDGADLAKFEKCGDEEETCKEKAHDHKGMLSLLS